MPNDSWLEVGATPPNSLLPDRISLHHAAVILGSVAHSTLPAAEDDSHSNLRFDPSVFALRTRPLTQSGAELALDFSTLTLSLRCGDRTEQLALAEQTVPAAFGWLNRVLPVTDPGATTVRLREYEGLPAWSTSGSSGRFPSGSPDQRVAIGRWFANGLRAFDRLARDEPNATERRVWPHHFDLGLLIVDSEHVTLGLGLSPGDHHYAEPYFYLSPYPQPEASRLPAWDGPGHWHTEGFCSLVLTATECLATPRPSDAVRDYLRQGVDLTRSMLAG